MRPLVAAVSAAACCIALAVACTSPPAANVPNAPTVSAAATQIGAIQSGAITPNATAQAVATRLAPTVQAVEATIGPIATSVAQSPVRITGLNVGANDTTVTLQNSGSSPVTLQDYTLFMGPNIPLSLPPIMLAPGQTRTLHMAAGTTTESDVYLNVPSVGAIATTFAPGQRAVLVAPGDQVASVFGRQ